MKKIFYSLIAAVLCLVACQKEVDSQSVSAQEYPEGATVEALFTVSLPYSDGPLLGTRAQQMAQIPVIDTLYIAIFGDNGGMLQQLVPAFPIGEGSLYNPETGESGYDYQVQYRAELPLSDEERNLHFIGNCPQKVIENLDFLYEKEFMDKLFTSGGNAAYWQKVVLPDGIQATFNPETGKFELTEKCAKMLDPIALVRNFAKLIVTSGSSDFAIESYALVNVPFQGTIAPYSTKDGFSTKYMSIGKYCDPNGGMETNFVSDLIDSGYSGYMTNDLINTSNPGETSSKKPSDLDNGLYMYERTKPSKSGEQTGLIIKLKWSENLREDHPNYRDRGQSRYYKIEVLDKNGDYMPIYRNVVYLFSLTQLSGEGETSFDDAFNGPFFGNVSASIETATLTEINDNKHKIVVNRMDCTTFEDNDQFDIYFQFYKTLSGSPETDPNSYATPVKKAVEGFSPAIAEVTPVEFVTWQSKTWGHIVVTLKERPASGMLREKLRIQGQVDGVGSLFRDIVFTVMNTQEFTSKSKVVVNGNDVTVTIGLPKDLPYSLFPLNVLIEAQNNNLSTSVKELPVDHGPTAFDEEGSPKKGKNSFYFVRTIQYKDYLDTSHGEYEYTTEFNCPFIRTDNSDIVVKLNEKAGYFSEITLSPENSD